MRKYTVSPAYLCGNELRCEHCWDHLATHLELSADGTHNATEHLVLCRECAYLAGLKSLELPTVRVRIGAYAFDLTPVIAPGDRADHPGVGLPRLYLQLGKIRLVARADLRAG